MNISKTIKATILFCGIASFAIPQNSFAQQNAKQPQKKQQTFEVDQAVVEAFERIVDDIKSPVKPAKPRKVLIYSISHGPHRFGIPTGKVVFETLGEKTGAYTAVVSDDLANFEPDALKQFDAVCFVNTTGEVFNRPIEREEFNALSAEEKKKKMDNANRLVNNLTEYVKNGGGFFGIHAATDTLKKSPAYGEMIGGYFDGHPWSASHTVYVQIEQLDHPLCKGVFKEIGFSIQDEIYQMKAPYSRDNLTVLMSLDLKKSDKPAKPLKRVDKDYPISWVKPYGKGRVFYSALGHNKTTFHNPLVLKHWLWGLQYATGDIQIND